MREWQLLEQQVLFEHPAIRVLIDTLGRGDETRPYFYITSPVDAVAILALDKSGQVVLTREYRHPVRRELYSLPGGRIQPGEEPLAAAKRELAEETGYRAAHWQKLGYYYPYPGEMQAGTNVFFARDLTPGPQQLDPDEELAVQLVTTRALLADVLAGNYQDGGLQFGVLMAHAQGLLTSSD